MKDTEGDYTFMKLHPHSVTKIRVYVYLEGQDVDNYDLITNDQNIIVNFGLTKERSITSIIRDDESGNDTYINGRYRGIIGDVNGDGLVTEDDATLLGDYVAVPELYNIVSSYVGDTNCDYKIDSDDTIEITKAVNNGTTITCPNKSEYYSQELMMGDLNSDGKLSSSDALAVTRYAGNLDPLTETQKYLGDVNCDGILTEDDGYIILRVGSGLLPNSAICAP